MCHKGYLLQTGQMDVNFLCYMGKWKFPPPFARELLFCLILSPDPELNVLQRAKTIKLEDSNQEPPRPRLQLYHYTEKN